MHKRHLHHILVTIRKVRVWVLVSLLITGVLVSLFALRQNNQRAVNLRNHVLEVDKQNADVEAALKELREYTHSHMHSSLAVKGAPYPPIQLKYRYERLVAAEEARYKQANADLYTAAQRTCEAQIPSGRSITRIDCIQNYITSRGAEAQKSIPDALYKFDFVAPVWSPDLAGWSIVITALLAIILLVRIAAVTWLKHYLHQHE